MSTRAQVRFATREEGVSFNEHPEKITAQFYVHSDGYPEGLGCQIAESLTKYGKTNNWEIEHVDEKHGDLEYIYYIWSDHGKSTWISIFQERYISVDSCIFVGKPEQLLSRFQPQRIYSDTPRCNRCECEDADPNFCASAILQNTN